MQAEQNKDPTERQMTKIAREAAKWAGDSSDRYGRLYPEVASSSDRCI